jgi:hypothetical protein
MATLKTTGLTAAALLMTAGSMFATTIPVTNASFETLAAGSFSNIDPTFGDYNQALGIPGWTVTGVGPAGQWQPTANAFTSLSDGPTVAYTNGPDITQVVGTVDVNTLYTLTVDLGWRLDVPFGSSVDFLVNGVQYIATGTAVKGTFQTFTATYLGLAADAGDAITVELQVAGASQGDFDNVTVNAIAGAVPEPGSAYLIGAGLLGSIAFAVRKRRA